MSLLPNLRNSSQWFRLQIRARRVFNRIPMSEQQKVYVLTLLIGGLAGLAAVLFHFLLDYLQEAIIYSAAEVQQWWRFPLLIFIPATGGLLVGACLYFLVPEARGSGIPQVKTSYYIDSGLQRQTAKPCSRWCCGRFGGSL